MEGFPEERQAELKNAMGLWQSCIRRFWGSEGGPLLAPTKVYRAAAARRTCSLAPMISTSALQARRIWHIHPRQLRTSTPLTRVASCIIASLASMSIGPRAGAKSTAPAEAAFEAALEKWAGNCADSGLGGGQVESQVESQVVAPPEDWRTGGLEDWGRVFREGI